MFFEERIGNVFEEDEAEDDVLVLGRVHVVAHGIGRGPELGFETEIGAGVVVLGAGSGHCVPFVVN